MSRSFKKTPYCGDKKGKKKKRIANKRIRNWHKNHSNELLQGNSYKKAYPCWEICEYSFSLDWDAYWKLCLSTWLVWDRFYNRPYPDKNKEYRKWLKNYKLK